MRFYELTDGALGVVSLDPPCAFMIDAADRPMVESKRWYFVTNRAKQTTYVMCPENGTIRPIHRILMDAPKGLVVDHINGDPLDNRRANLRLCTHAQNMAANHRYKRGATGLLGVHFSPVPGKFWASISDNSKPPKFHSLGTFATAKEAALARDKEAYRLRGEFARLNYPDELVK